MPATQDSSVTRKASHHSAASFVVVAALCALTVFVYHDVTTHDFINFDDDEYVYANPGVSGGVTWVGISKAFRFHAANWHPLTWMSHMVDAQLFGLDAGKHHAENLLIHVVNVLLLFFLLKGLTSSVWKSGFVAVLFAVHPLNVETVAWIAERKSLLSTAAWFVALVAYGRWVREGRRRDYVLLLCVFAAALLSKPMSVTLPATLLVLDIWPLARIKPSMLGDTVGRRDLWAVVKEKLPLFGLSLISAVVTYAGQDSSNAVTPFPLADRIANACISAAWYLWKAVIPTGLCVYYPHPVSLGETVPLAAALGCLASLLVLFFIALQQFDRRPFLLAGMTWYVITLSPVIGIIQVGSQARADRYAYVPLIGIFAAVVWLVDDLMQLREAKVVAVTFGSAVAIVLAVTATRQVSIWRDSSTLYTQALAVTGGRNPVVRRNLAAHYTQRGVALREGGNAAGALEFFELASAADFNSSSALFNHAVGLSELKRYSQAIPYYVRSLELDRGNADAWLNLGDAYVITGAFPAAAQAYRQTLTLRPDKYADYGLAWASAHIGDQEQAMRAFERLRAADPALAEDLRRRFDANR